MFLQNTTNDEIYFNPLIRILLDLVDGLAADMAKRNPANEMYAGLSL